MSSLTMALYWTISMEGHVECPGGISSQKCVGCSRQNLDGSTSYNLKQSPFKGLKPVALITSLTWAIADPSIVLNFRDKCTKSKYVL